MDISRSADAKVISKFNLSNSFKIFFCMIDLSSIETIVFDLGGVVVDLDLQLSINAFKQLGIKDPERFIRHGAHGDIFLKLETGEITEGEFFSGIKNLAGKILTDENIKNAWCAMFTDLPKSRVKIIERLKKEHRVILLSNTNSIHRRHFDKMAEGYSSLSELFDEVYYSFMLHDHKPNVSVFKKMIEAEGLAPVRTLFLDDSQKNIDAAREIGMQAILITPARQVEDVFMK